MTWIWWALVGGVLVAAVAVRTRFLLVTVDGVSMQPTLVGGDRLLVRRAGLAAVRRGGLVVVAYTASCPADAVPPPAEQLMVKRAVALPGDPVPPGTPVTDRVVPPGRLVVHGDNGEQSFDSRTAGYLSAVDVVGVVVGRRTQRLAAG